MSPERTIGAPLVYANYTFEKNCIVKIDTVTKKIINIAVNVNDMDSISSVEYHCGIITPWWDGWENPMTARKIKNLLNGYAERTGTGLQEILETACHGKNLEPGYDGPLMLLTDIDFKGLKLKENSNLKIL